MLVNKVVSVCGITLVLGLSLYTQDATAGRVFMLNGDVITGDMATGNIAVNGTGALQIPAGLTGSRPTGVEGMIRYNSTSDKFEGYEAGAWANVSRERFHLKVDARQTDATDHRG